VILLFIGTSLLVLEDFISSFLHKSLEDEELSRSPSVVAVDEISLPLVLDSNYDSP